MVDAGTEISSSYPASITGASAYLYPAGFKYTNHIYLYPLSEKAERQPLTLTPTLSKPNTPPLPPIPLPLAPNRALGKLHTGTVGHNNP